MSTPVKGLQASVRAGSMSSESFTPSIYSTANVPSTPRTPGTLRMPGSPGSPGSPDSAPGSPGTAASVATTSSALSCEMSTMSIATALTTASTAAAGVASPDKPKAFYRVTKLDRVEIERRDSAGHCTYCNESGHSRRSCAAGRLMRKVPKQELDARLRCCVCPLCGDSQRDGHSKLTCPRRRELQDALDAKAREQKMQEMGQEPAGKGQEGKSPGKMQGKLQGKTQGKPQGGPQGRVHERAQGTPQGKPLGRAWDSPEDKPRHRPSARSGVTMTISLRTAAAKTGTPSASKQAADEGDLIDLGDTQSATKSTAADGAESIADAAAKSASESTSESAAAAGAAATGSCPKRMATQPTLLDTAIQEVVWRDMFIAPCKGTPCVVTPASCADTRAVGTEAEEHSHRA